MEITKEVYDKIKKYALRLDRDNGEDACQEVYTKLLKKPETWNPPSLMAYLYVAVKREVWCVWEKQRNELVRLNMYYTNAPIPSHKGLKSTNNVRTMKATRCRKDLHDLTEDNLVYMGARRTCKACLSAGRKKMYQRRKTKREECLIGVV